MAPIPAKAAAPMPADDGTDPAGGADDMGTGDEADSGDQSDQVLCTILKSPDGGYKLVPGDEDDGGDGGEMPPGGGDELSGDVAAKPEGQTFSEPGALLKGVLDLLNKDAEASGGTNQSHFESGFGGDNASAPKKQPPPKY